MNQFRQYDPRKDKKAIRRIWREVGWLGKGKDKKKAMDLVVECGRALVAEVQGEAECLVLSAPGSLRYLTEELPFAAVTNVTTSRVARKQGLASHLTARLVAEDALGGALVSGLGFFEQGYYDQLGFGVGGYEHWLGFDPAQLRLERRARVPRRLTVADWKVIHASRLARLRGHGALNLFPTALSRSEMIWTTEGFGLGYYDGPSGELTHHLWLNNGAKENGPYNVRWSSYQTYDQFLELLALLKSLGDQVRLVRLREPQGIQLQDFLKQPFRFRQLTEKAKYENVMKATAYWQMRINDLPACLAKTRLRGETLRFNLRLTDPIAHYLDEDAPWRGVGGEYRVTLGPESAAETGTDSALPMLTASVNAFTRLWLGVRPATGLAVSDDLAGPPELLEALDWALRLPEPKPGWDF
ncbi:MAG: hypothetical protein DRI37_02955 [Chloroflexi bacterium]|nr:MAG: hypothetical protein DRI37_02955 [Chloroflexota bacterium]